MKQLVSIVLIAVVAASCSGTSTAKGEDGTDQPTTSGGAVSEPGAESLATPSTTEEPAEDLPLPENNAEFLELVASGDSEAVDEALADMSEDDRATNLKSQYESGDTPLLLAAREENLELFDVLAEAGADPNARDADGRDILNLAVRASSPELAQHALDAGTDPVAFTLRFRGSTLIFASERGEVEIVEKLIEAGAPIDRANRFGYTALIEATKFGDGGERYQQIVRALLEAGADQDLADNEDKNPLDYATEKNHTAMIELLEGAA